MSDLSSRAAKALGKAFHEHPLGAAVAANTLEPSLLGVLGEAARAVAYARCERADHGSYHASPQVLEPTLEAALRRVLEDVIPSAYTLVATRWMRFRRGDYSLAADDARWIAERERPHASAHALDVSVDLSADETGEGDLVFTHRQAVFFTVAQRLGQLAVVRRTASIARYDRYLTHRVGEREVHRLRLLFAPF